MRKKIKLQEEEKLTNLPKNEINKGSWEMDQILVVTPSNLYTKYIIDKFCAILVVEGLSFENLVKHQQANNQHFSFLFDFGSPIYIYYLWKMFSLLNGDSLEHWRIEPFQMFKNGPFWIPPPMIEPAQNVQDYFQYT